jgi:DNA-binding LacI/PurR family transcriptional regulator
MRESCREEGFKIVFIEDDEAIAPQHVDGIIFSADSLEIYAMGIPPEIPQVMLFQHADGISSVTADNFGGSKLATSYLLKKGHRRIACLLEEFLDIPIRRRSGYQAALQEAGISTQPGWLRLTEQMRPTPTNSYLEWGRRHMHNWLNEGWHELGCTAIVAQNDQAAIGVMQTLQEAKIDVPGQVSIIGFDGTNVCDLVRPRLTSVEVPLHEIGREAIKVLCDQIKNGSQAPLEISLPVKLREGDSVARINVKGE